MGVLTHGYASPSARPPIDTSKFFVPYMSGRRGGKTIEKISINFLAISDDSKHFSRGL